jgi:hypothetical protein
MVYRVGDSDTIEVNEGAWFADRLHATSHDMASSGGVEAAASPDQLPTGLMRFSTRPCTKASFRSRVFTTGHTQLSLGQSVE